MLFITCRINPGQFLIGTKKDGIKIERKIESVEIKNRNMKFHTLCTIKMKRRPKPPFALMEGFVGRSQFLLESA